jgi:hypothetical protein
MEQFLKNNWLKIIILILVILLEVSVINYINTATRNIVQRQNFSVFKWYIEEISGLRNIPKENTKLLDVLIERFGL